MDPRTGFAVFCLENYKTHRQMTGKQTAELFEKYDVYDYVYDFYDVLHTTGYQYINKDIDEYLKARGALSMS